MKTKDLQSQLNNSIKLAQLNLAPEEKKKLLSDLEEILGFVENIKDAEKKGEAEFGQEIAPEDREFPQTQKRNALREDEIESFSNIKGIISEMPQTKDNLIKVKKI